MLSMLCGVAFLLRSHSSACPCYHHSTVECLIVSRVCLMFFDSFCCCVSLPFQCGLCCALLPALLPPSSSLLFVLTLLCSHPSCCHVLLSLFYAFIILFSCPLYLYHCDALLRPTTCQSLTLAPALFPDLCMYCCPDISQNENGNEYPHFVFCGLSAAVRWMCCDLLLADTMKAAPAAVCSSCSLCFHSFLLSPVNLARIAAGICFLFFLKIFSSFISRFNNPTVFLE